MDRLVGLLVRFFVFLAGFAKIFGKTGLISYEEHRPGEPWKMLLVGYNGARNTGADARVIALTEQLKKEFGSQMEITVMTLNPDNMKGYFSPEVKLLPFSSVFFVDLFRACSSHHGAILCEGSTLKSTFANALTMFFCETAGIMKKQQKPCIAYGSEVGDMDGFLKKLAMEMCDETYFITRTHASQKRLESLGLQGHVGTDTAWTFHTNDAEKTVEQELLAQGWDGIRPLLGVAVINPFWWPVKPSVRKWLMSSLTGQRHLQFQSWYFFSDSPERRKQYRAYLEEIADAVNRYCREKHM